MNDNRRMLDNLKTDTASDVREWALKMEQALGKPEKAPEKAPPPERMPGPKRVLIIEDDRDMAGFLEDCLKSNRYHPATAFDGPSGLSMADSFKPDLVVLDLLLPGIHGYDVLEALRKNPESSSVKILISTAKIFEVDRRAAMRLGADAFLPKPYTVEDFLGWVSRLIG